MFEKAVLGGGVVLISEEIYTEMRTVVVRKFPTFIPDYNALEVVLREYTTLVPLGGLAISVCRDPKDNVILETAVVGDCEVIVTGDADLLAILTYKEISIVNPKQFLDTV